ncbi:TPA: hypothetical protein ACKRPP_000770 [Proteus mirabilis]
MIYTTGTVSTVSGSAIVSGTGTKWTVNNPAIRSGTIILIKNGNMNYPYMVDRVNSDTELVISQPATFTAKNTSYSINLTEPNTYSDANNRMTAIASDTTYFLRAMDQWMMNNGVVTVELPNGQKVTLDSIKKMQGDIANRADKSANAVQSFSGGIKAPFADAVRENNYFGIRVHTNGTSALYGFRNGSGFDYTFPTYSGEAVLKQGSYIVNYGTTDWTGVKLYKGNKEYIVIEGSSGANTLMQLAYRNTSGNNVAAVDIPKKNGTLMLVGDYGFGSRGNDRILRGYNESQIAEHIKGDKALTNVWRDNDNATKYSPRYSANLLVRAGDTYFNINAHHANSEITVTSGSGNNEIIRKIWNSGNTTVDSNGFIKRASPVININPDGTFTTNDESEGATVTRVAQGEYLIEGVLGFNSDAGWGGVDGGIEIPLDVNKQPLIWVDSKVMEDGSILVRTYHRTHPNAPKFARNDIDGYKDGDPIDIPDGRFISVRVQMPEQSIYNVRMREMEEAQKAEEERRKKEEGENQDNISNIYSD